MAAQALLIHDPVLQYFQSREKRALPYGQISNLASHGHQLLPFSAFHQHLSLIILVPILCFGQRLEILETLNCLTFETPNRS